MHHPLQWLLTPSSTLGVQSSGRCVGLSRLGIDPLLAKDAHDEHSPGLSVWLRSSLLFVGEDAAASTTNAIDSRTAVADGSAAYLVRQRPTVILLHGYAERAHVEPLIPRLARIHRDRAGLPGSAIRNPRDVWT